MSEDSENAIIQNPIANETSTDLKGEMSPKNRNRQLPWFLGPSYLLFWLVLFYAVIMPVYYYLPEDISVAEEPANKGRFIAGYAERILYEIDSIGPRYPGSRENEHDTVQLLMKEIEAIRNVMRTDLYKMETDLQEVSGALITMPIVNMYQGVQNIVVKLSPINTTSENYVLINSHFDTKPASWGAGDDGEMVVVMLEVLRQFAISDQPFEHPIVFLFNGCEEAGLQASHGFITKHKWAKDCRVVINLDAMGSGGRDYLFQGSVNHTWPIRYYTNYAAHPYANTLGEDIFQAGLLPSDTDFRNFQDYGLAGLDIAQIKNGFVYHTKNDRASIIKRGSLQSTGDNVLALARAFSNAPELYNDMDQVDERVIFFDFLGLFSIYYGISLGVTLNIAVSAIALVLVFISIWRIASKSNVSICRAGGTFALIFVLHLIGVLLAFGLPLLMAFILDRIDHSMSWFTNSWLNIGLYICPALFGLSSPTLFFFSFDKNNKIDLSYRIQMTLHAHSVILAVLCIALSISGIRSGYIFMILLLFYSAGLIINLVTTLHDLSYYWTIFHTAGQILSFLYITYLIHTLLFVLIPIMGRYSSATNPDLLIAGSCALGTVLAMGFLVALLNTFKYPRLTLSTLLVVAIIFALITLTSLGYPYRPNTNVGRVNFLHVHRTFYEYDGSVSLNDSGYLFDIQDRRAEEAWANTEVDVTGIIETASYCETEMMCGVPLFNHRWFNNRMQGRWLPRKKPLELPGKTTLEVLNRTVDTNSSSIRFDFRLSGPTVKGIFIQPEDGVRVTDWTFLPDMLENESTFQPPYQIFFICGNDNSPLEFFINLENANGNFDVPIFQLGISGHFVLTSYERDVEGQKFISSFPPNFFLMDWPSSYERYIF